MYNLYKNKTYLLKLPTSITTPHPQLNSLLPQLNLPQPHPNPPQNTKTTTIGISVSRTCMKQDRLDWLASQRRWG